MKRTMDKIRAEAVFEQVSPKQMIIGLILAAVYCSGLVSVLITTPLARVVHVFYSYPLNQQEVVVFSVRVVVYVCIIALLGDRKSVV